MNRLLLLAGVAVLGLAACGSHEARSEDHDEAAAALRTISKLDCPQKQGELELVSAAADGQSCAYKTDNAEVNLRLIALNGDARAALDPIETELKGVVPAPAKAPPATPATPATNADADKAEDEGKAEIDFPGLHIKADDGGANVRIGNIRIDADDDGAEIKVGGQTTVNANDGGAEIRTGTSTAGEIRSTYILASESAPNGYHVAGYEARGPKAGPIVVATVKARSDNHERRDLFDDLKDLVERQVGE